jgi:hypothetical protein
MPFYFCLNLLRFDFKIAIYNDDYGQKNHSEFNHILITPFEILTAYVIVMEFTMRGMGKN